MNPSPRIRLFVLILAWLGLSPVLAADSGRGTTALEPATNLAADAAVARERNIPILVFHSRRDCAWCARVRREHLLPLANDPQTQERILIRQIDVDRDKAVIDFSGRATTHRAYARSRDIKFVPALHFLDDQGKPLAEAIVGMSLPDYYGVFVERAIEGSLAKLRDGSK